MSVGQDFPVLGPGGVQKWWVIPEGFLGQLQNAFTVGPALHVYTVKESVNKPTGAVAGPFTTRALAQAEATHLSNTSGLATPPNIAGAVAQGSIPGVSDIAHRLTEQSTWIRVGEFVAGIILLYVGGKAFFPQTVNNVTETGKAIGKAAKMGII